MAVDYPLGPTRVVAIVLVAAGVGALVFQGRMHWPLWLASLAMIVGAGLMFIKNKGPG